MAGDELFAKAAEMEDIAEAEEEAEDPFAELVHHYGRVDSTDLLPHPARRR